jgi:dihydroorotate dehydrogenase
MKLRTHNEIMDSRLSKSTVSTSSGTRNYFAGNWFAGDGYHYHEMWKLLYPGFDFTGATHIAKTTLLNRNDGNLPWNERTLQPKSWFPDCIHIDWKKQIALNAVGLSGPGLKNLLDRGKWQKMIEDFFISIMTIAPTKEQRLEDIRRIYELLGEYLPQFLAEVGLEVNITCPNTMHDPIELADEVVHWLNILYLRHIHLRVKVNLEIPNRMIKRIVESGKCHSLSLTNTAKFNHIPDQIDWQHLFNGKESPLTKYGGGGLSGRPLFQPGIRKLKELRDTGITIPIHFGGGIMYAEDVQTIKEAGGSGSVIGSAATIFNPNAIRDIVTASKRTF